MHETSAGETEGEERGASDWEAEGVEEGRLSGCSEAEGESGPSKLGGEAELFTAQRALWSHRRLCFKLKEEAVLQTYSRESA